MNLRLRSIMSVLSPILLIMVSLPGNAQQASLGRPIVLRGATLIDGSGKPPLADAVVVIEGDRVKAAGDKNTAVPPGADIIDVVGKYIIPGLVDSHTHYQTWMGELLLNHGITSAMVIGPRDAFGEQYYQASHRSGVRTPRLYDAGPAITLTPAMTR